MACVNPFCSKLTKPKNLRNQGYYLMRYIKARGEKEVGAIAGKPHGKAKGKGKRKR